MAAAELPACWSEARFPVMASAAQVVVHGDPALLSVAELRLRELESRWSRFQPASEVSRLNGAGDAWTTVSEDTLLLIRRAVEAWRWTGGAFDPTLLAAIKAFRGESDESPVGAPGLGSVEIDPARGAVRLGRGVAFDPGGIGKGLAADLVATELVALGADAVLVNVGGDLRAAGDAPFPGGWGVEVEVPGGSVLLGIAEGGVATSSPSARAGTGPLGAWHHLFDPGVGAPLDDPPASATVVAPQAWQAEVWTKAVLRRGTPAVPVGLAALLAPADGPVQVDPAMARLLHGVLSDQEVLV
jgi:thiamine biosynthesis lipoprotein